MIPSIVATSDGFTNILRIWAKRDPKLFLQQFSEEIGANFEEYIAKLFVEKDFKVYKNIKLKKIQKDLPDIDLFIISKEPTLGFHIYIVEIKNPIPATWGKHYLKAKGKKGFVKKAFDQLKKIDDFLSTEKGVFLIYSLILKAYKDWSKDFIGGFFTPIEFFIVTSQNAGMFFKKSNKTIIDYHTLKRILEKCDGDVVYISKTLQSVIEESNKCYEIKVQNFQLDDLTVEYEVAALLYLFDFPDHKYKSKGIDKEIEDEGRKMDIIS